MNSDLLIPDRFEGLRDNEKESEINSIIFPVKETLQLIDEIYTDMTSAGRGSFLIFRGKSGSGKSTFLHTINVFRTDVEIISIEGNQSVTASLSVLEDTKARLRIIVIENKEALIDFSTKDLEKDLHAINHFLRLKQGKKTILVWPCNTQEMEDRLVSLAKAIGAEALLGIRIVDKGYLFSGPPKEEFYSIAKSTIHLLNDGASLIDLGVDEEYAHSLLQKSETIGQYLASLRQALIANKANVSRLLKKEQCRMWVVVIAGNEPENDVAALTRGRFATADVDRLMGSTEANIVTELKAYPEKLGILATVFDCRIFYLPILTALACCRDYGDNQLKGEMINHRLKIKPDNTSVERICVSEIANSLTNTPAGPRNRGAKTGSNTIEAFEKISSIAANNDQLLNKAFAEVLQISNLISSYKLEQNLGNGLTRRTDILCNTNNDQLRIEMMWRKKTGRGEIANYVLTKLFNYGKAIGFF